ncbi:MAG: hypothetical protein ABI613_09270 [Gemmatimonadota bacterium]
MELPGKGGAGGANQDRDDQDRDNVPAENEISYQSGWKMSWKAAELEYVARDTPKPERLILT